MWKSRVVALKWKEQVQIIGRYDQIIWRENLTRKVESRKWRTESNRDQKEIAAIGYWKGEYLVECLAYGCDCWWVRSESEGYWR